VDILLDTHIAVWWADDPSLLDPDALRSIEDGSNTVWFSAASAWELAIKGRSGKLAVDVSRLVDQLTRNSVRILGIGVDAASPLGRLSGRIATRSTA
jgi:PIN domain nuclease of toxin-antitoxin system